VRRPVSCSPPLRFSLTAPAGQTRADSERFYPLEDWIPNAEVPSTTLYLSHVQAFQKHNAAAVYLAVTGMEKPAGPRSKVRYVSERLSLERRLTRARSCNAACPAALCHQGEEHVF
jgi:hypothetical protein